MQTTEIEWSEKVWNPIRGCSLVSAGCTNCYAMHVASRFNGPGLPYEGLTIKTSQGPKWTGEIMLLPEKLKEPLYMKKSQTIFVNSMSDMFHEGVPEIFIDQMVVVMALTPWHTYQILTKRAGRMRDYWKNFSWARAVGNCEGRDGVSTIHKHSMADLEYRFGLRPASHNVVRRDVLPLPNVWLGVSVEDQERAYERIPILVDTPAAVRWLSMEPLLGPIDLTGNLPEERALRWYRPIIKMVDWVVVGGESGHNARPMHPQWARDIRDQCQPAGVPFFFKQNGEYVSVSEVEGEGEHYQFPDGATVRRLGKKAAGRTLDGRTWDQFPEVKT
jgi:protein gp37